MRLAAAVKTSRIKSLALAVGRVRLAGEENLYSADLFGDLCQPLGIGEEQAGAFVGCHAAGKTERKNIGVELLVGAPGHLIEQALLAAGVAVGDLGERDAVDGTEVLVVAPPLGDLRVEQGLQGF